MICRSGCAACCTVISISSPLPGMPEGKPAGVDCVNLDEKRHCRLHGEENYPDVCRAFTATRELCGESNRDAHARLGELELLTSG